jgi:TRAP-type C4-dicarboxylate transport system permease large subunit
MEKRGYEHRIVLGSLAAGGTLGILIPPSIAMIIYGSMTGQSIGRLFIAGVIPGIMLVLLFMSYIAVRVITRPQLAPSYVEIPLKHRVL